MHMQADSAVTRSTSRGWKGHEKQTNTDPFITAAAAEQV